MRRWIPWFLRALWQPDVELDLRDSQGRPDYGKVVGMFAFLLDALMAFAGALPPLGHFVAMNSLAFGWVGWRTFLKSKVATAAETVARDLSAVLPSRHDDERGDHTERESL